ncbi:MAG: TolC family protein [Gloeobacteraceae cyanobacterium ES-bin-316]|nr:TolC family protein [Ferruginibacter sp.]
MRLILLLLGFALFSQTTALAQQKWNLKTIVDYAMANNIGVKQSEVQAKLTGLTYKQSRLSQYPNLTFNGNTSVNNGNNQDPVTFQRINQTYLTAGMQLQTSADVFNFYSKRNTILANEWELKAAIANVGKIKNDIALSAANAYLQILLAMEQEKITLVQVAQTTEQLRTTRKQVDAGALPELNAVQLEAQLALDSVNYINAKGNVTQAILTLKSFMNIDAAAPFDVDTPPVESIPVEPIADLQPENVYTLALANQPLQQYNAFRLKAAEKNKAAAKGSMYPSFSVFGGVGTNYLAFSKRPIYAQNPTGTFTSTGLTVDINNTVYDVKTPDVTRGNTIGFIRPNAFSAQFGDNLNQSVGLGVSVPIFNGGSLRTSYDRSKLNISSLELVKKQDDQKLKQDIYQAHNAAVIALEKFNASAKSVASSEQTYTFANKRFGVGMLGTFDLITTQNNLLRAKLEYTINQFDYVFKMKVLEFYKGLGLKL